MRGPKLYFCITDITDEYDGRPQFSTYKPPWGSTVILLLQIFPNILREIRPIQELSRMLDLNFPQGRGLRISLARSITTVGQFVEVTLFTGYDGQAASPDMQGSQHHESGTVLNTTD
ncbi:hypothetical protein PUN28_020775 [Cardiocondyla obscurior]|uniref:Uncharacterized protein n=1 Tax=Cardiocondyla obscurior TaxID=286306 RepID=A0AAW2E749_9HYME